MKQNAPQGKGNQNQNERLPVAKSEEAAKDGESEDDEPYNVEEKEGLPGHEASSAVADLARPPLGDAGAGARRLRTATPIRRAVVGADRIGAETGDGAGGRPAVGSGGAGISGNPF